MNAGSHGISVGELEMMGKPRALSRRCRGYDRFEVHTSVDPAAFGNPGGSSGAQKRSYDSLVPTVGGEVTRLGRCPMCGTRIQHVRSIGTFCPKCPWRPPER